VLVEPPGGELGDVSKHVAVVIGSPCECQPGRAEVNDGDAGDVAAVVESGVSLGYEGDPESGSDGFEGLLGGVRDRADGDWSVAMLGGEPVVARRAGVVRERDEGFVGDLSEGTSVAPASGWVIGTATRRGSVAITIQRNCSSPGMGSHTMARSVVPSANPEVGSSQSTWTGSIGQFGRRSRSAAES